MPIYKVVCFTAFPICRILYQVPDLASSTETMHISYTPIVTPIREYVHESTFYKSSHFFICINFVPMLLMKPQLYNKA